MKAKELLYQVRFDLFDDGITKYSDFELLQALNSSLSILNRVLIGVGDGSVTKTVTLVDSATLPVDFVSAVRTKDDKEYRINGGVLYTDEKDIELTYTFMYPRVEFDDALPVPDIVLELLRKMTSVTAMRQVVPVDEVYRQINILLSGRNLSYIERPMPFSV